MTQWVEGSVEIEAPVEEVYGYWETLTNLPYFMKNVEEVRLRGEGRTHWKIKGMFGAEVEFDARTTRYEPGTAIGWDSVEGDVGTSGQVLFGEMGPGRTSVEVTIYYADPPGGKLGEVASRVLIDPQIMLDEDLNNLRDILELRATPEEVRARPSTVTARSAIVAALVSVMGLVLLGLALLVLKHRGDRGASAGNPALSSGSEHPIALPGRNLGDGDKLSSFTLSRYRWLASPEPVSPEKIGRPARRELRAPGPRPRAGISRGLQRGARRARTVSSERGGRDKPVVLKVLLSPRGRRLLVRALKSKRIRNALKDKRVRDALKNRHARRLVYRGLERGLLGRR